MLSKQLIQFAILAGCTIFLLSKIFWLGIFAAILWAGIELFKTTDTYKKYDK